MIFTNKEASIYGVKIVTVKSDNCDKDDYTRRLLWYLVILHHDRTSKSEWSLDRFRAPIDVPRNIALSDERKVIVGCFIVVNA